MRSVVQPVLRDVGNAIGVPFGGGRVWSPEFKTLYNAYTYKPDKDICNIYDDVIRELKKEGIWDKLDFFSFRKFPVKLGYFDYTDAFRWWTDPTKACEMNGYWNQVGYRAWLGFMIHPGYVDYSYSNYLKTGFIPAQATKFKQNDACIFMFKEVQGVTNKADCGVCQTGVGSVQMVTHFSNGDFRYNKVNDLLADNSNSNAITDYTGLWVLNRKSSSSFDIWQNKTKWRTVSKSSTGVPNLELWEHRTNIDGAPEPGINNSDAIFSCAGAGASLTDYQVEALSDIVSNAVTLLNNKRKEKMQKPYLGAGVCLSFDDVSRIDGWLIYNSELVSDYGFKATFFLNGNSFNKDKVNTLINSGHEIGNHTFQHLDWATYFSGGGTPPNFYNNQLWLTTHALYYQVDGYMPTTFGYAQNLTYPGHTPLNEWLYDNPCEFARIRPGTFEDGVHKVEYARCYPNNSSIVVPSVDLENWSGWDLNKILDEIDNAKNNNYIVSFLLHSIWASDGYQTIGINKLKAICQRVVDNGMKFYLTSELPYTEP